MMHYREILTAIIIFFAGAACSSFLLCVGERLAFGNKLIQQKSHCPHCGHELSWLDIIPVFSWLFLKGRCSYCKNKIPVLHVLTEITMGLLFVCLYLRFGFSLVFFRGIILFLSLYTAAIQDAYSRRANDVLFVIPAAFWAITMLCGSAADRVPQIIHVLVCILITVVFTGMIVLMERLRKKEVLGGADIKAIAVSILYLDDTGMIWMMILLLALIISTILINILRQRIPLQANMDKESTGVSSIFFGKIALIPLISVAAYTSFLIF